MNAFIHNRIQANLSNVCNCGFVEAVETTEVQAEIDAAVARLGLSSEEFRRLPSAQGEEIYHTCLRIFVTASFEPRWWWEHLRDPHAFLDPPKDGFGFKRLLRLLPDANTSVYFIAEDNHAPSYPVYLTTPHVASSVVGECFGYEYYMTPPDFSWLVGENHHDRLFAVGEPVVSVFRVEGLTL